MPCYSCYTQSYPIVYHHASVFVYLCFLPLCVEEACKIPNKKHLIFVFRWIPSAWYGVDSQVYIVLLDGLQGVVGLGWIGWVGGWVDEWMDGMMEG